MGHLCVVWNVLLWGVVWVIHSTTDSLVQPPQLLPLAVYPPAPNCSGSFSPQVALLGRFHHDDLNMYLCVHGKHPYPCHPKSINCFTYHSPLTFHGWWLYLASCFLLSLAGKWILISVFTLSFIQSVPKIFWFYLLNISPMDFSLFPCCHFSISIFYLFFFLTYLVLLKPTLHTTARIIYWQWKWDHIATLYSKCWYFFLDIAYRINSKFSFYMIWFLLASLVTMCTCHAAFGCLDFCCPSIRNVF